MSDRRDNRAQSAPAAELSPKLRAALAYLGDRLSTHPASRFRPRTRPLLEVWLATRRPRPNRYASVVLGGYRNWINSLKSVGIPNPGN